MRFRLLATLIVSLMVAAAVPAAAQAGPDIFVTPFAGATEATLVDEYWYSNDLRINIRLRHQDSRKGGVTMTVTEINRAEPDRALFEIPEGYTPEKRQ